MKKLLCVVCLAALSLAACDDPKQAKIEAPTNNPAATKDTEVSADKPADKPTDKPTEKIPAKPLDGPLLGDLKLPFAHHVLVDKTNAVANNTQRTLALQ
jgi:hypothetical protein